MSVVNVVNAKSGKHKAHCYITKIKKSDTFALSNRIHCFENVTAILFVVAASGYDQCLVEDRDSVSDGKGNGPIGLF
jgi:hypothetical protein